MLTLLASPAAEGGQESQYWSIRPETNKKIFSFSVKGDMYIFSALGTCASGSLQACDAWSWGSHLATKKEQPLSIAEQSASTLML